MLELLLVPMVKLILKECMRLVAVLVKISSLFEIMYFMILFLVTKYEP